MKGEGRKQNGFLSCKPVSWRADNHTGHQFTWEKAISTLSFVPLCPEARGRGKVKGFKDFLLSLPPLPHGGHAGEGKRRHISMPPDSASCSQLPHHNRHVRDGKWMPSLWAFSPQLASHFHWPLSFPSTGQLLGLNNLTWCLLLPPHWSHGDLTSESQSPEPNETWTGSASQKVWHGSWDPTSHHEPPFFQFVPTPSRDSKRALLSFLPFYPHSNPMRLISLRVCELLGGGVRTRFPRSQSGSLGTTPCWLSSEHIIKCLQKSITWAFCLCYEKIWSLGQLCHFKCSFQSWNDCILGGCLLGC